MRENLLKRIFNSFLITLLILFFFVSSISAKERWIIDKNISSIKFEVPVLFATNVLGSFENINGFVEIDLENKKNNKALLSIPIDSVVINYKKYRDLLLGPIFFNSSQYPLALLDTKKFSYEDENDLALNIELTIKGISKMTEANIKIKKHANDVVQIIGTSEFSRTEFGIGEGNWRNTSILKDRINITSNIFLIRE